MAANATILIVDDDLADQGRIGAALIAAGYRVMAATSTRDALLDVLAGCVDLVLLDATVAAFHDLDFLQLLREDLKWKDLPVVVLTDEGDLARIAALSSLGISLCIAKSPSVLSELPDMIAAVLADRPA